MTELTENNVIDSKYRLILMAAKRARQLQGGAKPLVHTTSRKHTRVALEELKANMLKFEYLLPVVPETVAKEPAPPAKGKR
ncbi:MAG: DNA-directed polymerase, omega subunit [Acidobacteria bacterium]|nr:DNA-directed polymerase, omega subunit [Acidobacteriota bacterium]